VQRHRRLTHPEHHTECLRIRVRLLIALVLAVEFPEPVAERQPDRR
jgi:hypothetical protein